MAHDNTKDDHEKHNHPEPLAYVDQMIKDWTCGGELMSASIGFYAVFNSAKRVAAMAVACARLRFPVPPVDDKGSDEVSDFLHGALATGSTLVYLAIKAHDLDALSVFLEPLNCPEASPDLTSHVVMETFGMLRAKVDPRVLFPDLVGDDYLTAAKADVRKMRELATSASGQASVERQLGAFFMSAIKSMSDEMSAPRPPRNKHELN